MNDYSFFKRSSLTVNNGSKLNFLIKKPKQYKVKPKYEFYCYDCEEEFFGTDLKKICTWCKKRNIEKIRRIN